MHCCVLEGSRHLRRDDIPGEPHHEQLAEPGVEQELRRHPRVAASEDGDGGMLLARAANTVLHATRAPTHEA
jgi:hypothetical protein